MGDYPYRRIGISRKFQKLKLKVHTMGQKKYKKVAVVMGGFSAEREVSLVTGKECSSALRNEGFEVTQIDAGQNIIEKLLAFQPDVIFNALHGRWGEDGCAQGIFEWLQIPYTHSGINSSSQAMDKLLSKKIYQANNLPTPKCKKIPKNEILNTLSHKPPFVLKPVRDGSSVGVKIIRKKTPPAHFNQAFEVDYMLEEYIPGRELTVSVLDDVALTVTEIITKGFYDYRAKYDENGSFHEVPARIPAEIFDACLKYAEIAHLALGCEGLTRTDFRWDDSRGLEGLMLLETNTQPGMTPTSLSPEQASLFDMDLGQLCRKLIELASCNK